MRRRGARSGRAARPVAPTEEEMALSLWRAIVGVGATRRVEAFRAVSMLTQWAEDDVRRREAEHGHVAGARTVGARTARELAARAASVGKARRVVRLLSVLRRHLDPMAGTGTGRVGGPCAGDGPHEQPGAGPPQTRPEGRRR